MVRRCRMEVLDRTKWLKQPARPGPGDLDVAIERIAEAAGEELEAHRRTASRGTRSEPEATARLAARPAIRPLPPLDRANLELDRDKPWPARRSARFAVAPVAVSPTTRRSGCGMGEVRPCEIPQAPASSSSRGCAAPPAGFVEKRLTYAINRPRDPILRKNRSTSKKAMARSSLRKSAAQPRPTERSTPGGHALAKSPERESAGTKVDFTSSDGSAKAAAGQAATAYAA